MVILALLTKFILHLVLPRNFHDGGEMLDVKLSGGTFQIRYSNTSDHPAGLVILGSGDGGWSYWEQNVANHLTSRGYAVGGWDCRKFADSRAYGSEDLAKGFRAAVESVRTRSKAGDVPVWYGGWSTGAEQAVAAAAVRAERPRRLVGLLLAAPGGRGRYGITSSDLLGMEPTGPDTFALADLAPSLEGLRVAQFAAGLDPLDDVDWMKSLGTIPHRLYPLSALLHDMGRAGKRFLKSLDEAMSWTLDPTKESGEH